MNLLPERLAYIYAQLPELEGDRGQIGLVRASGASKSMVNQWLNGGVKSMSIEYALNIEANLGFCHLWLMANIGEPKAKPGSVVILSKQESNDEPKMTMASSVEIDLLDLFRRSTERGANSILDAARAAPKKPAARLRSN